MERSVTILLSGAILLGVAQLLSAVPLPGDVALTLLVQDLFASHAGWALAVTETGKLPGVLLPLAIAAALAFWMGDWRAAGAPLLAWLMAIASDKLLRLFVFEDRPSADLVSVFSASTSSGLPSTFGLTYGAVFGALFWIGGDAARKRTATAVAAAALLVGALARVVPGGHWPSQMLASLALGIVLGWVAVVLIRRLSPARPR